MDACLVSYAGGGAGYTCNDWDAPGVPRVQGALPTTDIRTAGSGGRGSGPDVGVIGGCGAGLQAGHPDGGGAPGGAG